MIKRSYLMRMLADLMRLSFISHEHRSWLESCLFGQTKEDIDMRKILILWAIMFMQPTFALSEEMAVFPSMPEYKNYGPSNLYHFVCLNAQTNSPTFSLKISLEANYCTSGTSWIVLDDIYRASLWKNEYTGDGMLLWCKTGPEDGDIGCNMVYYVNQINRTISVRSIPDIVKNFDFGIVGGLRGKIWGAYYLGSGKKGMKMAIKVGYGLGTNQIYEIGMKDFSGSLITIRQGDEFPIISETVPDYERAIKFGKRK